MSFYPAVFPDRLQKLNRMRALQARGAHVTEEEREMMDELALALKETDASDDKVAQSN